MKKSELRQMIQEELNAVKSIQGNALNERVDDGAVHVQRAIKKLFREINDAKQEYDYEDNQRAVNLLNKAEILIHKAENLLGKIK